MKKKRLYKSRYNKKIAGVCGGIADYFDIDPAIVRIICALLICAYGTGLLVYIVAAIVMDEEPEGPDVVDENGNRVN